jgi:hypothetical protein
MRKSKSRSQAKSSLLVATSVTAVAAVTTVAAVTAAVTTTATTVAAASTTTETAAVTAGRAGVGDVNSDATAVEPGRERWLAIDWEGEETDGRKDILLLVQGIDSSVSLLLGGKGNETETTGTAGLTVAHDDRVGDLAELAEGSSEGVIGGVPRQVSNVKLRHDCACCCKCSRERSKRSESS